MSCYNAIVLLSMYFLFSSSNSRATYFPHLEHIQLTITRWVKATFLFPLITWYVLISCTGWHFGRPQLPTLCRHWKDDFLHIATTPDAVKILRFTHLLSLGMWLGKDKSGSMKVARRRRHTVAVDKPWNQKSKACYRTISLHRSVFLSKESGYTILGNSILPKENISLKFHTI